MVHHERAAEVPRRGAEQASLQQELQPHQLRRVVRRTPAAEPERCLGRNRRQKQGRHQGGGTRNDRPQVSILKYEFKCIDKNIKMPKDVVKRFCSQFSSNLLFEKQPI